MKNYENITNIRYEIIIQDIRHIKVTRINIIIPNYNTGTKNNFFRRKFNLIFKKDNRLRFKINKVAIQFSEFL